MTWLVERVLRHEGRLDVLCCLLDSGPLGAEQVSARTRKPRRAVDQCLQVLEQFELIVAVGGVSGANPLYALNLDRHPEWVRETIEDHRAAD